MVEWFKSLTFFNWLSLIGFCLALVGFLNSFLSLRSRYKDWLGLRNKKAFEKRLKELKTQVDNIVGFRKKPTEYYFLLVDHIFNILVICLFAATFFAAFIFSRLTLTNKNIIHTTAGLFAIFLLCVSLFYAIRVGSLVTYIAHPKQFINKLKYFIKSGRKKNVIDENGVRDILEALFSNQLITVGEYEDLEDLAGIPIPIRASRK